MARRLLQGHVSRSRQPVVDPIPEVVMTSRKITDLPKKSVSSEQAEDVKGGRKMKKFAGKRGNAKKKSNIKFGAE
jgi:hypothetical protein